MALVDQNAVTLAKRVVEESHDFGTPAERLAAEVIRLDRLNDGETEYAEKLPQPSLPRRWDWFDVKMRLKELSVAVIVGLFIVGEVKYLV